MPAKKTYAIVDVETTGGSPRFERITEVGIVLFDGEQVIDTFESLVNPEQSIPEFITKLTGITNEMVQEAPRFYEIAKKIVELTQGAVFVAHNARFDYGFLRSEFKRLGYTYTRRQLCTVKLSRRVFPGLPSYSLGKLIRHFDIPVSRRHRALDDALATTELLRMMLEKESGDAEVLEVVNRGIKETQLPDGITLEKLHELPEECGVYYFHNAQGRVVYVGKSINIKKRVMDHFKQTTRKSSRMHQHVRDISFELTGSELVALLYESHEIKRLHPMINRAQRMRSFPYVVHTYVNEQGYRCFGVEKATLKQREKLQVISEYPKAANARGHLGRVVEELELCRRLCGLENNVGTCLYHQIKLCRGGCMGKEPAEEYNSRAEQVVDQLSVSIGDSFAILGDGRHEEERSVVLVEEGRYQGFGYLDREEEICADSLRRCITAYENNPEVMRIIRHFLRKNPKSLKVSLEE